MFFCQRVSWKNTLYSASLDVKQLLHVLLSNNISEHKLWIGVPLERNTSVECLETQSLYDAPHERTTGVEYRAGPNRTFITRRAATACAFAEEHLGTQALQRGYIEKQGP